MRRVSIAQKVHIKMWARILVGVVLPPILGTIILFILTSISSPSFSGDEWVPIMIFFLICPFIMVGIGSIIFSLPQNTNKKMRARIGILGTIIFCILILRLEANLFFIFYFLCAFIVVGIQSIIFSLLMEFLINRRVENDFLALVISTGMGLASGGLLVLLASRDYSQTKILAILWETRLFMMTGALVGLVVGWLLRKSYQKEMADKNLPTEALT